MAYAALVSLAQTIDLILNPRKYSISLDAKHKIMCIQDSVIFLLPFLESYPSIAKRFEGLITDVAYGAEDILEFFMWNHQNQPRDPRHKYFRLFSRGVSKYKFEDELEKVKVKIRSIAEELMDIKKSLRIEDDRLISDSPAAVLSSTNVSTGKNNVVIGLDDDVLAIKGRLYGESSKLEVISITGMEGIGKTTLARNAYNDPLVLEHFDIHAWITVSQDYSADEILLSLLGLMKLLDQNEMSMREKVEKVYKHLKWRRYLIVC